MNITNTKILGVVLMSMGLFLGFVFYGKNFTSIHKAGLQPAQIVQAIENLEYEIKKPQNTTIAFVGDIMFDRGVKGMVNKYFDGDYGQIFANTKELKDYDILFGNLEGPVSDKGKNVGSIYSFRMNPVVTDVLRNAGFDIVSFANNHAGDWGLTAFTDTLNRLTNSGILYTGAGLNKKDASVVTIINKNGTKFGFVAFSDVGPNWIEAKESSPGILIANDPEFMNIIKNAKSEVDFLIVSFHWGDEYQTIHNTRQEKLAHNAIDAGADMIIGHHPHVIQDIGIYKGKTIVYSLGNFVFDQYFSKETMQGMMYVVTFNGNNIVDSKTKIVQLNNKYQIEYIK